MQFTGINTETKSVVLQFEYLNPIVRNKLNIDTLSLVETRHHIDLNIVSDKKHYRLLVNKLEVPSEKLYNYISNKLIKYLNLH